MKLDSMQAVFPSVHKLYKREAGSILRLDKSVPVGYTTNHAKGREGKEYTLPTGLQRVAVRCKASPEGVEGRPGASFLNLRARERRVLPLQRS